MPEAWFAATAKSAPTFRVRLPLLSVVVEAGVLLVVKLVKAIVLAPLLKVPFPKLTVNAVDGSPVMVKTPALDVP